MVEIEETGDPLVGICRPLCQWSALHTSSKQGCVPLVSLHSHLLKIRRCALGVFTAATAAKVSNLVMMVLAWLGCGKQIFDTCSRIYERTDISVFGFH